MSLPDPRKVNACPLGVWTTALRHEPYRGERASTQHIGLLIATYADASQPQRPVWASKKALTAVSGRSKNTVKEAVERLRLLGYLTQVDVEKSRAHGWARGTTGDQEAHVLTFRPSQRKFYLHSIGVGPEIWEHPKPPAAEFHAD